MAEHLITGAKTDGAGIQRQMPIGEVSGKLFVLANSDLYSFTTGLGRNKIGAWKSTDDGSTWHQVGGDREYGQGGFWSYCVDGRGAAQPYLHCVFGDTHDKLSACRFNMATEDWDLETHSTIGAGAGPGGIGFFRAYIASGSDGQLRALLSQGNAIRNSFHHFDQTNPVRTIPINTTTYAFGTPVPVAGQVIDIDHFNFGIGIGGAPESGASPGGSQGFAVFYIETTGPDGAYVQRLKVALDGGGVSSVALQDAENFGRVGTRVFGGGQESAIEVWRPIYTGPTLTSHQTSTVAFSNPTGVTIACDHTGIPPTVWDGFSLSGMATVVNFGTTLYLLWWDGAALKSKSAAASLSSCSWGVAETLLTVASPTPYAMLGASPVPDGIGITFSKSRIEPGPDDEWIDCWYVFYGIVSGCPEKAQSDVECASPDEDATSDCGSQRHGYAV